MNEPKRMQVTLKLYCDQSHLSDENQELIWEVFVNGSPFPSRYANILETRQINSIVGRLVELEHEMAEPDDFN